jgi:hypothetical protein
MNVLITLTTAGADTGPFNLYSNVDSYTTPFETGVAKSALVAGYLTALVPTSTNTVRVKSTGLCTNYIDIYVTGSGTTTTTTTIVPPTTTTTTTQIITYYNVVLCGTSTPGIIRYNGPNNVSIGVVVQSTNGQCYTISSVGTGPETVGTLLTQFVSCGACEVAPPPTTTTTSTSTSTSTTTSTSTSTTTTTTTATPTTTTTTTATPPSCGLYRVVNNDSVDRQVYWYDCGTSSLVIDTVFANSNYNTTCANYGTVGTDATSFTIDFLTSCTAPTTTTTSTSTTAPPPSLYEFRVSGGTQTAPDACLLGSPGIYTVYSTDPNPENNATLYTTNYVDEGTIFTANNLAQYWNGLEYPDNSGTFNGAFIVIRKADQTAYYYNCLDLAGVRYCSGYCGG